MTSLSANHSNFLSGDIFFSFFQVQKPIPVATDQMTDDTQNRDSSISIDSNITDNITWKVINVQQEKCRPTMELSGTPGVTGHFSEDFPSRTT